MEGWKDERIEEWKDGRMEEWKYGRMEGEGRIQRRDLYRDTGGAGMNRTDTLDR